MPRRCGHTTPHLLRNRCKCRSPPIWAESAIRRNGHGSHDSRVPSSIPCLSRLPRGESSYRHWRGSAAHQADQIIDVAYVSPKRRTNARPQVPHEIILSWPAEFRYPAIGRLRHVPESIAVCPSSRCNSSPVSRFQTRPIPVVSAREQQTVHHAKRQHLQRIGLFSRFN